jgi:glycosyltransferase involved in cell wall biosynthesis
MFRNVSNRLAYHWQFFTPVGLRRFLLDHASSFDVAHLHACHNLPGVFGAAAVRRAGIPYVLSPHGTALRIERRRLAKRLFDATVGRDVLPRASRVLAVSEAERRQLHAAGVRQSRILMLPNPIDLAEFDRLPDAAPLRDRLKLGSDPLVVYLGKLTPRKGVDVLVRAFSCVSTPGTKLLIAGNDMGAARTIDDVIRRSSARTRITRLGLLRGAARLDALAAADVVVYPSRDEVFGLVPMEAVLCGRPVIVSDDSGCADVVRETGGGLIVPWGDERALASAIDGVLKDATSWTARVATAAARVRRAFATDVICERLEQVYQEVCA